MAFNDDIREWLANYSSDGTNFTLPIATLTKLSAGEAHTSTGDIRKFLYALADHLAGQYATKNAAGDAPGKMSITKGEQLLSSTVKRVGITFQFDLDISAADVADE